uniref:Uncharacterized protein n=1 Tax=Glossina pallidipes TaxID=7398 RepID=A0A1B0A1J2_GLOPL
MSAFPDAMLRESILPPPQMVLQLLKPPSVVEKVWQIRQQSSCWEQDKEKDKIVLQLLNPAVIVSSGASVASKIPSSGWKKDKEKDKIVMQLLKPAVIVSGAASVAN